MSEPAGTGAVGSPADGTAGDEGTAGGEGISYGDAVAELERILDSLESDRVDVDTLAERVERAAMLIRLCRTRLGTAREQVEAIVAELDDGTVDGER